MSQKKRQPSNPRVLTKHKHNSYMGKMLRAHMKRIDRKPTTPKSR